ncbi:hypothetical protein [Nonomuraea rubra]|uniref:hypothetical protein n=1 Tax=Nonomuraea rubra TaxID=46180 RepID=UPI003CD0C14E
MSARRTVVLSAGSSTTRMGGALTHAWGLGDRAPSSTPQANPTHTYTADWHLPADPDRTRPAG